MATSEPILRTGHNCWRIEKAHRLSIIIDGQDYFRSVKEAVLSAEQQIIMIGWDFDTRLELEPDEKTLEGENELGDFLNTFIEERPELDLKVLKWNLGAMESLKRGETPLFILKWMASSKVEINLDSAHPAGASHHQKTIVIDDRVALSGGIDITKGRWDTREHLDDNPARRSAKGELLGPWHDATVCVDGPVAAALGDLARIRWKRAVGDEVAVPDCDGDPWPKSAKVHFRDVDVAIVRTMGAFDDYPQVSEIETLTLDVIARTERILYIESQYFASRTIVEAIADRLREEDGPEVVVVNPQSQDGWLEEKTMGGARSKLLAFVKKADTYDRFRLFYPVTANRNPIYVHAKILVSDDRLFKIGSANVNNRSMGFDTECDLCVEATEDQPELREKIAAVRDDLLCEHLGIDHPTIRKSLEETGSYIRTIETFAATGQGFEPLSIRETDQADEVMEENDLMDPERPADMKHILDGWIGEGSTWEKITG